MSPKRLTSVCIISIVCALCNFTTNALSDVTVTTLAGLAGILGSTDGTGSDARFALPYGVAVDSAGNVYVADFDNHTIRKVTSEGVVTTLAGVAGSWGSTDGTGSDARFNWPFGVAVDSAANVYVPDRSNHTIRKITPEGFLQFSSSTYSVNENAGTVTLYVTRTNGNSGAASVAYAMSDGTATAGSDYTSASGTLSWSDGESTSKTIAVSISDDSSVEGDETFTVTLSNATGAGRGAPSSATVTIVDNNISAPTGVSASDGTYTDKVRVTWDSVTDATGYGIWRNATNDSSSASELGTTSSTNYDDTSASPGTSYYYWVKATNASVTSEFSSSDSGWRSLSAPEGVEATDGTYTDKIRLTWNNVTGATSYDVWRNTSNNAESGTRIAEVSETSYEDTSATT